MFCEMTSMHSLGTFMHFFDICKSKNKLQINHKQKLAFEIGREKIEYVSVDGERKIGNISQCLVSVQL